jgi:hypothetical protein
VRVTLKIFQRTVRSRYRRRIANQVTSFQSAEFARHFESIFNNIRLKSIAFLIDFALFNTSPPPPHFKCRNMLDHIWAYFDHMRGYFIRHMLNPPPDVGFLAIGPNPKEFSLLYLALVVHNFEYPRSLQISFEFPAIKSSRHCIYCSK